MTQTPSENKAQWDATRFFQTLNHFGEIPFLGSFRWLQQWLGQAKTFPGKAFNSTDRKVVVIGDLPPEKLSALRQQVSSITQIQTCPETAIQAALSSADDAGPDNIGPDETSPGKTGPDTTGFGRGSQLVSMLMAADTVAFEAACLNETAAISAVLAQLEKERRGQVVETVFDFSEIGCDLSAWGALDDVVMGGVSEGQLFLENQGQADQRAVFAGAVSTENSGGFSSIRTQNFEPPFDFSGWLGLRLTVKGDGQRYKFILRNSAGWDSPAYIYSFDTVADEWISIDVPFAELVPTFRAKSMPDASPYDPARTVSFQLMLSKFEYDKQLNPSFAAGPFRLAVKRIGVYRAQKGEAVVTL